MARVARLSAGDPEQRMPAVTFTLHNDDVRMIVDALEDATSTQRDSNAIARGEMLVRWFKMIALHTD